MSTCPDILSSCGPSARPNEEIAMITVENDALVFEFPKVHAEARLRIELQRTLRIPDDGRDYPLPPGLGRFPLRQVERLGARAPKAWRDTGGAALPMYQSEAMWISLRSDWIDRRATPYPFAIKISAGRLNAVSGEAWRKGLHREPQDYVVAPEQPWLDGFCVGKGVIRQFVAMPLGAGYSAEEQLVSGAHWGGLRIAVYPMKRTRFEELYPEQPEQPPRTGGAGSGEKCCCYSPARPMGLGAGGRMRQEIYEDGYRLADWDRQRALACHLHIANSLAWHAATGALPPTPPPTAAEYDSYGLPWFDYYDDRPALEGAGALKKLKSVAQLDKKKGNVSLLENESTGAKLVVKVGKVECAKTVPL